LKKVHSVVAILALLVGVVCTFLLYLVLIFSDAKSRWIVIQIVCCLVGMIASISLFCWLMF
jgi:hypothetical protein